MEIRFILRNIQIFSGPTNLHAPDSDIGTGIVQDYNVCKMFPFANHDLNISMSLFLIYIFISLVESIPSIMNT